MRDRSSAEHNVITNTLAKTKYVTTNTARRDGCSKNDIGRLKIRPINTLRTVTSGRARKTNVTKLLLTTVRRKE